MAGRKQRAVGGPERCPMVGGRRSRPYGVLPTVQTYLVAARGNHKRYTFGKSQGEQQSRAFVALWLLCRTHPCHTLHGDVSAHSGMLVPPTAVHRRRFGISHPVDMYAFSMHSRRRGTVLVHT